MLSEHSDLAWFGMTPLRSVEGFIIAAGSGLRGLCQFFVLKDKATFSLTLAEARNSSQKDSLGIKV